MSERPAGWPGFGSEPGSALERALAEVRSGAPEYSRWWREHGSTPPWSDEDEEHAARLRAVEPSWMRSVADELDRAHTELRDIGADLARIAGSAIGTAAAAHCAQLAATSHERATEAAALASGARTAGGRAEDLIDEVTRRLVELVGDGLRGSRSASGVRDGYEAVLRAVRAELASAVGRLPTLVGLHPGDRSGVAGWGAEPVTAAGSGGWTPEAGDGPLLPSTDTHRVSSDVGVRIARLPDGPAG